MRDRPTAASTRYELLARELEQLIAAGVLRPGDRLPSVRQACARRGASPSTVFQAYHLLEARGLVRAAVTAPAIPDTGDRRTGPARGAGCHHGYGATCGALLR
jgi:DNA-binding transcriptional MocR family regulator